MDTVLRSFKLPPSLDESLTTYALEHDMTKSDLVRDLLIRGLAIRQSRDEITQLMADMSEIKEKLAGLESKLDDLTAERVGTSSVIRRRLQRLQSKKPDRAGIDRFKEALEAARASKMVSNEADDTELQHAAESTSSG